MVWGSAAGIPDTPPMLPPGGEFNDHHPEWRPQMRPGQMRPGFFPYPRRGMHMRPGFFPGPRPFVMPPQNFVNQRKMRPWVPRPPRPPPPPPPPHFPPPPPESYMPFPPQPPWPAPPPPPPPPPPEAQSEADTTSESTIRKKKKRAANGTTRPWDKDAAERAHALELECQRSANAKSIVIRFPDPELSKEIVQGFHNSIDNVHFQGPCGGRYCFVTLKEDANVDKVMEDINKIKFGVGFLNAEKKAQKPEENATYENIDPYTLYVGNLSLNITVLEVKEKFPTALRIDVGHAKRMKNTRYAFVKFSTAEAALEAYKASVNTIMASRSIIVRFRRHKAPVGPPGEKPAQAPVDVKPGEKLTVGAKLKAKKEKAKAEKAAKELDDVQIVEPTASNSIVEHIVIKDEEESDEEVELENDDESLSEYDLDGLDVDADDDDDDIGNMVRDSDTEEEYEMSADDDDDMDDDDDDLMGNIKDEDDDYFDDDDCKDVFSLTFRN